MEIPAKPISDLLDSTHCTKLCAPYLLIATPLLQDPNFERCVVLIVEHTSAGALGFVINRPTAVSIKSILKSENEKLLPQLPTWYGGPVDKTTGIVIHNSIPFPGDTVLPGGIVISSVEEALERLIYHESKRLNGESPKEAHHYRFVVGYAGWGGGQLDEEIRAGAWEQVSVDAALVFNTPWTQIWDKALGALGTNRESLVATSQSFLN